MNVFILLVTRLIMPEEIEVKILNIDKQAVVSRLESIGAQKILDARQKIWSYDFPERKFKYLQSSCRIKTEADKIILCYKHRTSKQVHKVAEEHEVEVSSLETACKILEGIGLVCVNVREKDRTSYVYQNIRFDIDQWPRIPVYVEVESTSHELVDKGVALLGFPQSRAMPLTWVDVFKMYGIDIEKEKIIKF